MPLKVGVENQAKAVKDVYFGTGRTAKRVLKIYYGVGNVAKKVYEYDDGTKKIIIHYRRNNSDYTNWNLWVWEGGQDGRQVDFTGSDDYGKVAVYEMETDASTAGIIVRRGAWLEKDIDADRFITVTGKTTEVWLKQGVSTIYTRQPS